MKLRFVLMFKGKVEYDFELKIKNIPKEKQIITIKTSNNEYNDYVVEFIRYCFEDKNKFKYVMITAIRKE